MKKLLTVLLLSSISLGLFAKSYPFMIRHSYDVQVVRVANQGEKFYKVLSEAGSVNKAIDQAMQDAVVASLFFGVQGTEHAGSVPPICGSIKTYEEHRDYFDTFFKKGEFMQYVRNVNSQYPSGENNVRTRKGHRVGLYVVVKYDALRKKMENDGIIKSLNNYF